VSAAARPAHGFAEVAASPRSSGPSNAILLLVLVIGLAAATVWFVALPLLDRPAETKRSCEVFVLKSGATKCVRTPGSTAAAKKAKPAKHAKHAKH
jgi:hypothetical protein